MADRSASRERWIMALVFTGLMVTLILFHLVPRTVSAGRIPGPDFLVALTLAWVLRRPHYTPTLLIAALFLLADVFFMRPIGLHTALIVLAVEFLRTRGHATREQTFPAEWLMVAGFLLAIALAERILLGIFVVAQPAFGLVIFQVFATALIYPAVVLVSHLVFGITKMSASEAEAEARA